MLTALLLASCMPWGVAPAGMGNDAGGLRQSVTLEEINWATPAVDPAQPAPTAAAMAQPAQTADPQSRIEQGEALYLRHCAPCHRPNGEGNLGRFPSLNRNAFVTNRSPAPLIRTVLYGRGLMPAFDAHLSDAEIAATLSYVRNAWSNRASVIDPSQVAEVMPLSLPTPTPAP